MTQVQNQVFLLLLGLVSYAQAETEAAQLELGQARFALIDAQRRAMKAETAYHEVVDELMQVRDELETLQAQSHITSRLMRCA